MSGRRWGDLPLVLAASLESNCRDRDLLATRPNAPKALSQLGKRDGVNVNVIHPGATETERFYQLLEQRSKVSGKSIEQLKQEATVKDGFGEKLREARRPFQRSGAVVFAAVASVVSRGWVSSQSARAARSGSVPVFCHHNPSSPQRWTSRWCARQSGTVNSSLTLRPSARDCANRK